MKNVAFFSIVAAAWFTLSGFSHFSRVEHFPYSQEGGSFRFEIDEKTTRILKGEDFFSSGDVFLANGSIPNDFILRTDYRISSVNGKNYLEFDLSCPLRVVGSVDGLVVVRQLHDIEGSEIHIRWLPKFLFGSRGETILRIDRSIQC